MKVVWITLKIKYSLERPKYSRIPVRGTCGATFVTPHYAITAAHCVDGNGYLGSHDDGQNLQKGDRFLLETYDTENLIGNLGDRLYLNQEIEYPYWHAEGQILYDMDGYRVDQEYCEVVARCDPYFGEINADIFCRQGENGKSISSDIALVYCSTRESGDDWFEVANNVTNGDEVVNLWFHEIVNTRNYNNQNFIDHYLKADGKENYHYLGDWLHYKNDDVTIWYPKQLLPLISQPWMETGHERVVMDVDMSDRPSTGSETQQREHPNDTGTNLYGCHGTSGSGVFKKNSGQLDDLELLGPAVHSYGNAWTYQYSRLCVYTGEEPGNEYGEQYISLNYTKLEHTQALADIAYMLEDEKYGFEHEKFYNW